MAARTQSAHRNLRVSFLKTVASLLKWWREEKGCTMWPMPYSCSLTTNQRPRRALSNQGIINRFMIKAALLPTLKVPMFKKQAFNLSNKKVRYNSKSHPTQKLWRFLLFFLGNYRRSLNKNLSPISWCIKIKPLKIVRGCQVLGFTKLPRKVQ